MKPDIHEIRSRSILSKSGIPGMQYCVNPYVGCTHACLYCYATFMKKFSGHTEPWGSFADVKLNAPEVLRRQLRRAAKGNIMLSSVTDPYQPVEARYKITRRCLEVIGLFDFPLNILTKSPLVLRDLDIITSLKEARVGMTITTENERMKKIFEPFAPSIHSRLDALKKLHEAGVDTYVFIGPLLPMNPESLAKKIGPYANTLFIDRMNYMNKTAAIYRKYKLEKWLDKKYTAEIVSKLQKSFSVKDVSLCYD